MSKEKIKIHIDNNGNMFVPEELRKYIKPNMLLTCISKNTILVIPIEKLNNVGLNQSRTEKLKKLRILKANSVEFKLDESYSINIPDFILDRINFRDGIVLLNEENNFQIINSKLFRENEDRMEESYEKQI